MKLGKKKEDVGVVYLLNKNHFRVAVFGSARIKKNDSTYKKVETLAKNIGKENMDIITGGGPGLMHAANSGYKKCANGKNHSIGLAIELPFEQQNNWHLDIEENFKTFSKRLDRFMELSHAVIVTSGGIGTALELFYTWQLIQVKHKCTIPIILYGDMWPSLVRWIKKYMLKEKLINKSDLDNVYCMNDCRSVIKLLKKTRDKPAICKHAK